MGGFAWVTLATNDSYSLGALVLAHSLRQAGTAHQLAVLVTPGVTKSMREKLASVFNVVQDVDILDSKDEANLQLLKRPELGVTFTKLHCWRLAQFEKCVFLDADTLVLKNADELFERDEFSAAPDVGWPDCFNSGVFVYRPSIETYDKIVKFALEKGSFDGGDQGLLNLYFSDWAHKDISKHLPFIYNMCSTACYSYLPAFKQFGSDVKIVHFIAATKPWLQCFNTETKQVEPSNDLQHLKHVLQLWWDLFCGSIHPNLSSEMDSRTQSGDNPLFIENDTMSQPNFWDPWDDYDNADTIDSHNTNSQFDKIHVQSMHNSLHNPNDAAFVLNHNNTNAHPPQDNSINTPASSIELDACYKDAADGKSHLDINTTTDNSHVDFKENLAHADSSTINADNNTINEHAIPLVIPPNPPIDPIKASEIPVECEDINDNDRVNGGLAGAFAQFTLGAARSPTQTALEDHLRRQGWDVGNIDYMGRDSFDNIWSKICETIAAGSAPEKPAEAEKPSQPTAEGSVKDSAPVSDAIKTETKQEQPSAVTTTDVKQEIKTEAEKIEEIKEVKQDTPSAEQPADSKPAEEIKAPVATEAAPVESKPVETVETTPKEAEVKPVETTDVKSATESKPDKVEVTEVKATPEEGKPAEAQETKPAEIQDAKPIEQAPATEVQETKLIETTETQPAEVTETKPAEPQEIKPVEVLEQKPVEGQETKPAVEAAPAEPPKTEEPKPGEVTAAPAETTEAMPAKTQEAKPAETQETKPAEVTEPKPVEATESKPAETTEAKPTEPAPVQVSEVVSPAAPADAKPVESTESKPAEDKPAEVVAQPVSEKSVEAETTPETQQAKPVEAVEAKPAETQESKPAETQEATPAAPQEVKPVETQEAKPTETSQAKPVETQEAKPAEVQEVKPAETQEVKPAETQEAKPTEQQTAAAPAEVTAPQPAETKQETQEPVKAETTEPKAAEPVQEVKASEPQPATEVIAETPLTQETKPEEVKQEEKPAEIQAEVKASTESAGEVKQPEAEVKPVAEAKEPAQPEEKCADCPMKGSAAKECCKDCPKEGCDKKCCPKKAGKECTKGECPKKECCEAPTPAAEEGEAKAEACSESPDAASTTSDQSAPKPPPRKGCNKKSKGKK